MCKAWNGKGRWSRRAHAAARNSPDNEGDHDGDDASALALVLSLNVQRRDLTAGQRAIVAARTLPTFQALGNSRMAQQGGRTNVGLNQASLRSRNEAVTLFKVGKDAIQQAKSPLSEAPDLAAQGEARLTNITNA